MICNSKFANKFFVYLPVFLIFLTMAIVYCSYLFTYIIPIVEPVSDPSLYPFNHTATLSSGKTRGYALLGVVTLFFALCITSLIRVIVMDPGYVPNPLEFEYKILLKQIADTKHSSQKNELTNFDKFAREGPLNMQEQRKINKFLTEKEKSPIINNNIIADNDKKDPFDKFRNIDLSKIVLCGSCLRWKIERSHHCRQCGKCVLKMDHHCPWLANCIGFRNYKYFLLVQLHGLIATSIVFLSFIEAIVNLNMNDNTDMFVLVVVFFGWACDAGLFAFLLWLFCINWKLMFRGESVIENSERKRFPSAKSTNIYDLGYYRNFTTIFGKNPLVWFIPFFANYEGEGYVYETNISNVNEEDELH